MAEIANSTVTKLSYNAHEGANLVQQVAKVILVVFPRGLTIAGFSPQGDLLIVHYTEHNESLPRWILDFYEHRFIEDKLLSVPEKIAGIFVASDKYLLVPDEVYNAEQASDWMRKIFFIESNEVIEDYRLYEDKSHYLFAYPSAIKNLSGRYFHHAAVLPLAAYQFYKPYKMESALQFCVGIDYIYATLYKNKQLAWHQVFPYQCAEDIAYQINLMCKQYRIESQNMEIQASVIHKDLNNMLSDLTQYFPKLKYGNNTESFPSVREWIQTAGLLQQLYSCVS